ncbi:Trigger factor [Candidatus Magnetomorum sp. HK-1]|nr:Trigger factor [Candidatus Magnetomorum sp. HK-1]
MEEQMQFQIEDVSGVKKILKIEIPEKVVTRELNSAYRELKQSVNVKGFRKGKVPRSVMERMFGKDVHENVRSELVREAFKKALVDSKLNTIGDPDLDIPDLKKGSSFEFTVTVDVKPDIGNVDFKGLTLSKNNYVISDDMVDKQIETHRQTMATTEPILENRSIQLNDVAVIDYEGFKDGVPFELLPKTTAVRMELGKNELFPNFDENLLGMNKDQERSFDYSFPENFPSEGFAGQNIQMKVVLTDIRKKVYPELNDEFAKKMGNFQSMDELKKAVNENYKSLYANQAEKDLQELVFTQLLERVSFDVPEVWIKYELEGIMQEIEQSLANQNMSMEQVGFTPEKINEQYRDLAITQARRHLLLNHLIEQEKLVAKDEEVDAEFEKMSAVTGKPIDEIKAFYNNEENRKNLDMLKYTMLEKKALQMVLDANTIEEVELQADSIVHKNSEG